MLNSIGAALPLRIPSAFIIHRSAFGIDPHLAVGPPPHPCYAGVRPARPSRAPFRPPRPSATDDPARLTAAPHAPRTSRPATRKGERIMFLIGLIGWLLVGLVVGFI